MFQKYFLPFLILSLALPLYSDSKKIKGVRKGSFTVYKSLVDRNLITSGGPPKDGIPALDESQIEFLPGKKALKTPEYDAKTRALVVKRGNTRKAYTVAVLNHHEIVNDKIEGFPIAVTYCPLCGSGVVFEGRLDGKRRKFGVSGLLYQSDVLLYDKKTETLWSQLERKAVAETKRNVGTLGTKLTVYPSQLVLLGDYLKKHPETKVLSPKTPYPRNYGSNPYAGYAMRKGILFKESFKNFGEIQKDPEAKSWSLLVESGDQHLILPLSKFKKQKGKKAFKLNGESFVVEYDKTKNIINCTQKPEKGVCFTSYKFALKAFYPKAKVPDSL